MRVFLHVSIWRTKNSSCLILLQYAVRVVGFVETSIWLAHI
jgi:hypothetical protein